MHRSILLSLVFILVGTIAHSQNCSSWKKAHCQGYMSKHCKGSTAALAASADANIITVRDEHTGMKTYLRKTECAKTGSVTYQNVIYSSEQGAFVCDLSKCDLSKCDLSKCNISKCRRNGKTASQTAVQINKKKLAQVRT